MNNRRLFIASCLALIATSMAFSIRADIIPALKADFGFTDTQLGAALGPGLWGFAITIVLGGMLVDTLGMGTLMGFAFFGHLAGALLTIFAQGYTSLWFATLLIGLANGTVEAVTNPLVATIYPKEKTKHLNILHAWWPGGLVIGGLLGYGLTKFMALDAPAVAASTISLGWKIKMALIFLPTLAYGYLFFGQKFPKTERVASGISTREMFRESFRPMFLVFLALMALTTATELGPDQWIGNLLMNLVGIQGVLLLVYTAGIMFVLRQFFAGALVRKFTPLGLLTFSSIFSALGLFWLSHSTTAGMILLAATVFALGKTFFWPTMVGYVSEQFPRGGAWLMGLMGGMGMFCAGWLMSPIMGSIQDHYALQALSDQTQSLVVTDQGLDERKVMAVESVETRAEIENAKRYSAVMTYRWVSVVPAGLFFIFGGMFLYYRSRGGYRAVHIAKTRPSAASV